MNPQIIKASDGTELDASVVNLAKSIRRVESNNNYSAVGKSGERGAYQWMQNNYESGASELGIDPNDRSPVNQDKVAYHQLKKLKDKGYSPEQVSAAWNAGEGRLKNDQWKTWKGKNAQGVDFDTPGYVDEVIKNFQNFKGQSSSQQGYQTVASLPKTSTTEKPIERKEKQEGLIEGVGSDLSKRVSKGAGGVSKVVSGLVKGNIGQAAHGLIQTAGEAGGAVGDVTSRLLDKVPGVKAVENLIGQGVGSLAKTPTGQSVIKSITEWSEKNPELARDIGATFNIVTAIPILKGLGSIKNIASDAVASSLKRIAEKGALKDMTTVVSRTQSGRKSLSRNPDTIKTLIDERALPDIEDGKFTVQEAKSKLGEAISTIEDAELQPALSKANSPAVSSRIPLEQYKKEAMQDAMDQLKDTAPIEKYFDRLKAKYGDYPTLLQMNEAKRIVSRNITDAGFNSPTYDTDKVVRSALQKSVEEGAKALGLSDIAEINGRMARLIKAQDLLSFFEGKPVRIGKVGGLIQDAATAAGEMAGNTVGIPLAGAFLSREAGGFVGKRLKKVRTGILNRTGKDATKTPLVKASKKIFKGILGTEAQESTKRP